MQDFIGRQIDHYHILATVGLGGMAVVYKAYDLQLERDVALKLIRTDEIPASQLERLMQRFEREARAQARFSHPHIIPAYDYGEFNGTPYLVLAYLPGGTLKDRIQGSLPVDKALRILVPIADAVAYAHCMGVLHRDIKPSNIIFSDDDRPLLTDFGIAKMLETTEATLTGTGLGVGTPEYMAPEQWQGQACEATDQYALGVVLYELVTGQKPYTAETPLAVALKQINDPLMRPSTIKPDIPEELEKVLYKVLARDPKDRYEDVAAFRTVLESLAARLTPQPEKSESNQLPAGVDETPVTEIGSEAETIDVLESTPAEVTRLPTINSSHTPQKEHKHRRLSAWALWAGSATLVLIVIMAGIRLLGSNRAMIPDDHLESTESIAAVINTPIPTDTKTPVPTKTHTLLSSPTATETALPTSTPTEEPTLGFGSTLVNTVDGALMVYIPEGEFLMGSESGGSWVHERPQHIVYLDSYWISKHEVTNSQFDSFVQATGYQTTAEQRGASYVVIDSGRVDLAGTFWRAPEGPGSNLEGKNSHPVVHMSWFDAVAYCDWAEGRLPTEAEWEKAARGDDRRKFPWGNTDTVRGYANFCDVNCTIDIADLDWNDGYPNTSPVGTFTTGASPYGVMDMAGNVWEWVQDWYADDYYSQSPYNDPQGPNSGNRRVMRGGSWDTGKDPLRTSFRYWYDPVYSFSVFGFRCVHDIAP